MAEQDTVRGVEVVTGAESEPLRGRALYTAIASFLVALAVDRGPVELSPALQTAATVILAALPPLVVAWWARRHVNSPATMRKILSAAPAREVR